jgi:arylsulfatase A-like enzyme
MRTIKPALKAIALVVILSVPGCGRPQETLPPDAASPNQTRTVPKNDREDANRPANMAESEQPDDVRSRAKNPLIRGIRDVLKSSTDPNNTTIQDLDEELLSADEQLTRVKQQNREAIKNANRQVRLKGQRSPNIILLVARELGYGDLGCYGQRKIETPYIDLLAKEGIRFTDYYAGSFEGPTARWCLMSGLNSGRARGSRRTSFALPYNRARLGQVLWQAGYTTGIVGLCGIETEDKTLPPAKFGYEESFGYLHRTEIDDLYPEYLWSNRARVRLKANSEGKQGQLALDALAQQALSFIDRNARRRPFFLYVSYTLSSRGNSSTGFGPYADEKWANAHKTYAASVSRLDRDVGTIIEKLNALEIENNTIVVFTSETGLGAVESSTTKFFESYGPFRSEPGDLSEGRMRVPLVIRWPAKIGGGRTSNHICAAWDLLPTFAEISKAARRPRRIDGLSFLPTLLGKQEKQHDLLYWESRQNGLNQAVRIGHWKAIIRPDSEHVELYDLNHDPAETTNVAKENPEILQKFIRKPSDGNRS